MSSITAVRVLASLVCVASWSQAVDAPPQDPVHEYQRRLFAEMPFNDRGRLDRTGDPSDQAAWPGAAASHYDVPYLGADRDRLYQVLPRHKDHPWGFSWRTRADIHIPPGDGPFPCLVLFHGGAYQEGDKRGPGWIATNGRDIRDSAMTRGYVVVSANYLLGFGIHPQVQRDARELVRFLRVQAATYKINPHRIGLVGSSAGGWLAGASGLTTADDGWKMNQGWGYTNANLDGHLKDKNPAVLLLGGEAALVAHSGMSARTSVIMADFLDGRSAATPDDPHVLTFTGGKTTKSIPGLTDVTVINIPGKDTTDIHVPVTSGMVPSSRGTGEVTVYDRLLEFLEDHLKGSQARAPAPEARPNQRWFEKSVMVELAGSGPGSVIRYTTDGSNPDLNSPIYQRPFEIHAATEVKAISVVDGMRPSGPMTARFFLGTPPPAVTAPEGLVLPPARVGEPYSVTFRAPGAQRWQIIVGSHPPRPKENGGKVAEFAKDVLLRDGIGVRLGLTMASNGDTASLQGTPNRPGWTTVLVAASHAQGQGCPVSGDRLYLLRIDP